MVYVKYTKDVSHRIVADEMNCLVARRETSNLQKLSFVVE
jgi:hypothetical protein